MVQSPHEAQRLERDAQRLEQPVAASAAQVAEFDQDRSLRHRVQHRLHMTPSLVPLFVVVASIAGFGLLVGPGFFSAFALTLILKQVAVTGIVGAAEALVILTAGIELSVGAIMVICSVIMGQFVFAYGLPAPVAVLGGLGIGALIGFINGTLVARAKLPPFIVTLGMWQIVLAANYLYSGNQTIGSDQIDARAPLLNFFGGQIQIGGAILTYGALTMIALVLLLAYVLRHTAWGRHVYAVGDDPDAAELAGVKVGRVLVSVYTLAGLICALAGWVLIGRVGAISPNSGQFENINAITATVIGGISLFGGRGSILGMMFGALIVGVFTLGLNMYGTDPQWTYLLIGLLIILAVAVDQWIRKVSA
ncbi:ABC transporter permease [Defluviimonas sp. 20V17]|uniref:ABC transporter permease n=1 Tax=Allgaiera indica TaxID=765699 RepID=A0AAN4UQ67_9RHOB|nr:ABC transporter permease [Allgaiera indica]KDB03101.1 ABC transporter permease [Defluviimonas sp. 20V17]GHE00804.1 ABC transporter permease [Allgaiera indica]SDW71495.1 mannose ABC transporter membrane protein /fructose ABC transporter membrane protein /ribose ABC transporter membrane protein [Allgaiera indica]